MFVCFTTFQCLCFFPEDWESMYIARQLVMRQICHLPKRSLLLLLFFSAASSLQVAISLLLKTMISPLSAFSDLLFCVSLSKAVFSAPHQHSSTPNKVFPHKISHVQTFNQFHLPSLLSSALLDNSHVEYLQYRLKGFEERIKDL